MIYLQAITTMLFALMFGFMRGNYLRNLEHQRQHQEVMKDVDQRRSTVLSQLKSICDAVLPSNNKYIDRNSWDIRYKKNPIIEFMMKRPQDHKWALTLDDIRIRAHNNKISRRHMRQLYRLMWYSEKRYNEIDFRSLHK